MYPSRGNNAYGQQQQQQQSYSGQPAYGQHLGGHPFTATHYGGQYASVYGSMALSSALEVPGLSAKSGDYSVHSQKYGQKDLSEYVDRAGVYAARDLQHEPTARFGDSIAFGHHQHQGDIYGRLDGASAVRKELLQSQTLQSSSIEGSSRQSHLSYNGRIDDLAHHAPSILGAVPPREVHTQKTSGYGVSLPPGRDYTKSHHNSTPHQGPILPRGSHTRANDHIRERARKREREREREGKSVINEKKRKRTPPPVKEKRRDYVCKANSLSLVDVERDYLSIEKRYPRLFTSPECSKVIVNWSRENLKIPLNVPVSFEHDFIKDDKETQEKEASITTKADGPVILEHGTTQWNAKILLMSGLSQNALEELSSERDYEDRIPHFCNMIRFACLKKGNTLKPIGGLWDTIDGNDPSVDKSTLIHTALRYAKDLTGLDLKKCQHWNPFLEIHYDRVKKDGTFSHKEVTVLYIPDLSDCLPSINEWRDQWLAHKKPGTNRDLKNDAKPEEKKVSESIESASELNEKSEDKVKEPEKEEVENIEIIEKKNGVETEVASVQTPASGKKKIIKKVIKKKVVKKEKTENTAKESDTLDSKKVEETSTETVSASQGQSQSQGQGQGQESTSDGPVVKTLPKRKVIRKVPVKKAVKKEDEGTKSEVTPVKEQESSENKPKNGDTVKKTVKKKIIKRVVKKKVVGKDANMDKMVDKVEITIEEQKKEEGSEDKNEKEEKKEPTKGIIVQCENKEKLKEVKVEKEEGKSETKGKDVKDSKKEEEVPRHPGLFLQTKDSNKFHSSSISLESLLNYDDNDIDESTFELSIFAETFYEMLQYQMGSRILSFLQKLRIKFVAKRNEKKRQLEETSEKEKVKTSNKRLKSDMEVKSVENGIIEEDEKNIPKVENMVESTKSDEDEDMTDSSSKDEEEKVDLEKKEIINKELLQAFRFFDRNRIGHIRVEDMRLIIHNLGNFLSHREVKELVQSALLESNTGRDDRILYNKLVRMSDI